MRSSLNPMFKNINKYNYNNYDNIINNISSTKQISK
jgi:hypothetical protein